MKDVVLEGFVRAQQQELECFCESSSRVSARLVEQDVDEGACFLVQMLCRHVVLEDDEIRFVEGPVLIVVRFPRDYLRRALNPGQILTLLEPRRIWHPNIQWPGICSGHINPGTSAVELILRCYGILTYNNVSPREDDSLNVAACRWARQHMAEFPLENRPLKDAGLRSAGSGPVEFELEAPEASI